MITKEHNKHGDIARPSYGNYCRNEWAIVGAQCNTIRSAADDIIKALSTEYKCAYADAKHTVGNETDILRGAAIEYINHSNYHQFNYTKEFNRYQYRHVFNDADIILVNGNHFEAAAQIIVIDESKKESLKKRLSQLTNVEMILLADNEIEVFDFIKEALPFWDQLPVHTLNETDKTIEFFKGKMQRAIPLLNGLVLAGGKSLRMGHDKGVISWHGKEQRYYLADLLQSLCNNVYISCRLDQQKEIDNKYQTLTDTFTDLGPFGAILSAFREKPDAAWLVVACDLPLLDAETLQYLKENRHPSSAATAFESTYNSLPEPLITIWEPKSYAVLLSFLSQGYNCPVKALRNSDTFILQLPNAEALTNVNTREELEKLQQVLQKKSAVKHAI